MRTETFHGEVDLTYIIHKSTNISDVLVVSFPGADGGFRGETEWGYIQTINKFDCNALFLKLDNDNIGYKKSRMTCINRDFIVERSVIALIEMAKEKTGSSRIIAIGSSMGGWCSLYYGLKYGYDIIAGSMPYKNVSLDVMYTAGNNTHEDVVWANNLLTNVIKNAGKNYSGSLYLAYGKGEPNWTTPDGGPLLLKDLDDAGIKYKHSLLNFSDHRAVYLLFPEILESRLKIYLGLAEDVGEDTRTDEMKAADTVNEICQNLFTLIGLLQETKPNLDINERAQYSDNNRSITLRNYVYAAQGYFWYTGLSEPLNAGDSGNYWGKLPSTSIDDAISFGFIQSILNHYVYSGNEKALEWCGSMFLKYIEDVRGVAAGYIGWSKWWTAARRLHFCINYHCLANGNEKVYCNNETLKSEILECMKIIFSANLSLSEYTGLYRFVLTLLHTAQYFRENNEFFERAYDAALKLAHILTDYYFDKNGVCICQQCRTQYFISFNIKAIQRFIEKNIFPENKSLRRLYRKFDKIINVTRLLVNTSGCRAAFGYSVYTNISSNDFSSLGVRTGTFIKPESNLAVISTDTSYITVNSGTNIHAKVKHCDLLSFEFCYDKQWLVLDSEGGDAPLDEFSISSVAHSALLCDDLDYTQPTYIDWTAMDDYDEQEDYIAIYMSHRLIKGVELKRTFIWLKSNVIILYDEANGDSAHKYTQNFILPDVQFSGNETVSLKNGSVELLIKQFYGGYELKCYSGTTNKNADMKEMRGSQITGFTKLRKGLNLAYDKQGENAVFLTVLEAHSSNAEIAEFEISVKELRIDENKPDAEHIKLIVSLSNGDEKTLLLKHDKQQCDEIDGTGVVNVGNEID